MNVKGMLILGVCLTCSFTSFGERLVYKTAYEVIGDRVNVRTYPTDGPVMEQLSAPSIVIQGDHDYYDDDGNEIPITWNENEWISLVDMSGYEEGYIASKFVRQVPFRAFDSSFCGSYIGQGAASLEDYSYSMATLEEKPNGWYVLTITDYSQPNENGLRSYASRILAGKPIHEGEYEDDVRLNNFDGLMMCYDVLDSSVFDKLKKDEYPDEETSTVSVEYFIVTGPGELCSRHMKLTKD